MNRLGRYLVPFAAAAMLGGCGVKESIKDADVEIRSFHKVLGAGDVQQIWTSADPQLRKATTREQFERFLDAVHRKLGKVKQSKQFNWNATSSTGGTYVTVTMQTEFERGSGTEQFVYHKDDGKLALVGYHIQSEDMMVN